MNYKEKRLEGITYKELTSDHLYSETYNDEFNQLEKLQIVKNTVVPEWSDIVNKPEAYQFQPGEDFKIVEPFRKVKVYQNIIPSNAEYLYRLKKYSKTNRNFESIAKDIIKYYSPTNEEEVYKHISSIFRKLLYIRNLIHADYSNDIIIFWIYDFQKEANHYCKHLDYIKLICEDSLKEQRPYVPNRKYIVVNPLKDFTPYELEDLNNKGREKYYDNKVFKIYNELRYKNEPHTVSNYSELLGVSIPTARKIMKRNSITIENNNINVAIDKKTKIKELKDKGLSKVEIQKETGFSRTTIYKHWDNL